MSAADRNRWNQRYAQREPLLVVEPDEWLVEAIEMIGADAASSTRRALDLACGLGHNAIWLALQGWRADAVDVSDRGLELARQSATTQGVEVCWVEADLDDWTPAVGEYDLAVVFRFLDRQTVPRTVSTTVRPGGWLVYETFSLSQCSRSDDHICNPEFLLTTGELLALFPDFDVIAHREDELYDRTVERFLGRRRR